MSGDVERSNLYRRIRTAIRTWPFDNAATENRFNELALDIFRFQYRFNQPYRRYCLFQKTNPDAVRHWKEIPALPVSAFKQARVCSFTGRRKRFFQTSGTTRAICGRHHYHDLRLYEESLIKIFESLAINKKQARQFQFFFLIRSAKAAPQSSLSHMIGVLDERLAEGRGRYYYSKEGLEFDLLLRDLSSCSKKVFLFATSSALLEFLQRVKLRKTFLKLAPDSRFFETGGFKAASRRVSRERVDALCLKHLSLKAADRVGEFGMTEMFSQFYSRGAACVFKGPPWARCVARLPSVAKEAPPGRAGVLSFCDLANLDSVIALQTEDRGFIRAGGFEYLGRIPQAARRGCSLDYAGFVR